jgi:hypothetical protein
VHQALARLNLQQYSAAFARLGFNNLHALLVRSAAGTLGPVAAAAGVNTPDRHRFEFFLAMRRRRWPSEQRRRRHRAAWCLNIS